MKKMKLGYKLTLGGVLIVLLPLLVVGIFAALQSARALEKVAMDQSAQIAKSLSNMVQMVLQEEVKNISGLSVDPVLVAALTGGQTEAASAKLSAVMKKIGNDYETIMLIDASGVIQADGVGGSYKGINVGERDYVVAAKGGKAIIGTAIKSKKTGNPVAVACAPVHGPDGQFVGALGAAVKMDFLIDKLSSVKLGQTGYAFMIDKTGVVIAHPKKEFMFEMNLANQEGMKQMAGKMIAQQSGAESYTFQGVKKLSGFAPVELTGWSIGVTQNWDELMASATSLRNYIFLIGLIFLAITVAVVVFFSRNISQPITRAVHELNEAADQVASASHQVSSSSQSLAEGASEQASAIEETSSSLEEMSSMTRQNADNANHANSLMGETRQTVERADASMKQLTHSMQDISKASEETSKIVKTIDEIAFQTNLLALNAAVEAARAGEAGAGFAVVAEEVRNLAMRAAEAAKNTSVLIEGTVKKIKEGSGLVEKTNHEFVEVSRSAGKAADLVGEISAASNEQAQGIGQISKAIAEMDKVVQQNAATAEESSSASEEMNAQAQNMKGVIEMINQLVGGGSNGTGANNERSLLAYRKGQENKKGRMRAIGNAVIADAHQRIVPKEVRRQQHVRPDQVIPMNEGDFKDF
jgi:methyl-accepting chemotaxis protein